ncbi:MAG: hypothetical protein AAFX65_11650 [Cyanobacteria bacterium J06638_7]
MTTTHLMANKFHQLSTPVAMAPPPAPSQGPSQCPSVVRPELIEEAQAFLDEYSEDFTALASL